MDFAEFQKMLLESLKDKNVKSELVKLLSDDNVSGQLKEYEDKIKELEEKLASVTGDAEAKYSRLLSDYNAVVGASEAAKVETEVKDNKIAELEKKNTELTETIDKLNAGTSVSEKLSDERIAKLTEELETLKTSAAAKDTKISELSASENALKAQLETQSASINDMKKQLESSGSDKNAEIGRLTEKVNSLTAELENEKAQTAQKSDAAAAAEKQAEELKKNVSELESKLSEAAAKAETEAAAAASAASAKTSELESKITELESKVTGLTADVTAAKSDSEQKDKTIDELRKSNESSAAAAAAEKNALSDELNVVKNKYDLLAAEFNTYKATSENSTSKISELEAKLSEAQEEIARKDGTIAATNSQLQGMLVLREKINEYAETANAYAAEVENARNILADKDNSINELSAKVVQYTEAIETKNSQIEEIGKYAESLKAHAEDLQAQMLEKNSEVTAKTNEVEQLKKDMEAYNLTFGDLTRVFEKYQNLTPGTKKGLEEVFSENINVRSFLSSGAQWGHIQALWEFTQQKINNEDFSDIKTLNDIFKYFLDFHNSSYSAPKYALLETKPGEQFNEELHTKLMTREERKAAFFDNKKKGAAPDGPVKEVVLDGYKNLSNGRVLKQSVVRV